MVIKLATFRLEAQKWDNFQLFARKQGTTATALLQGFVDSCLGLPQSPDNQLDLIASVNMILASHAAYDARLKSLEIQVQSQPAIVYAPSSPTDNEDIPSISDSLDIPSSPTDNEDIPSISSNLDSLEVLEFVETKKDIPSSLDSLSLLNLTKDQVIDEDHLVGLIRVNINDWTLVKLDSFFKEKGIRLVRPSGKLVNITRTIMSGLVSSNRIHNPHKKNS